MFRFVLRLAFLFLIGCQACTKGKEASLPIVKIYQVDTAAHIQLKFELAELCRESNGSLGLAAYFGDSDLSLQINETDLFPLASVYKVPIVATLLAKVDEGHINFDTLLQLTLEDRRHSGCFMDDSTWQNNYSISARTLCHEMLRTSDNCATDAVLRLLGGPEAVREQLKIWEISGINVDRYLIEIFAHLAGRVMPENQQTWTFSLLNQILASSDYATRRSARVSFWSDLRDTGSPESFVRFHRALNAGLLLSKESTEWLCHAMAKCRTGTEMVPCPPTGAVLAHKTGSLPGIFNDAGWLDKGGHHRPMFYAVFMKGSTRKQEEDKELIMKILDRLFTFNPLKEVQ